MKIKKLYQSTVYRDPEFFASFPAVTALPDGRLLAVFRRAPNYCRMPGIAEDNVLHLDYNSKLMGAYSADGGRTWSEPELLYAPPAGAAQDGGAFCDGKYVYVNSFVWGYIPERTAEALKEQGKDEYLIGRRPHPDWLTAVPYGSVMLRRELTQEKWEGPFFPEPLPDGSEVLPGRPRLMHNRANICRGIDGSLLWAGEYYSYRNGFHASCVLYRSIDDGRTFQYLATPAPDNGSGVYEEPFLYITPGGKYVMLIRCHQDDFTGEKYERAMLYITESSDQGKSWSRLKNTGIHAEPAAAYRLDGGECLLVYGYRNEPFGVRGRICDAELEDIRAAEEFIIRDDGGRIDTGYPWIAPLGGNRYFVIYYNNHIRHQGAGGVEGTVLEIVK
ncbi:MAG: exo-alpha-sialidase [Lentisphaeria bacterium]|nr:exo-alpha-sialidase [Lentisphaeria bacterium]